MKRNIDTKEIVIWRRETTRRLKKKQKQGKNSEEERIIEDREGQKIQ